MIKFTMAAIAVAACSLTGGAQERFDPAAASMGGIWMRRTADPWCVLDAQPLLAFVGSARVGVAHSPGAFELSDLAASAVTLVFPVPSGGAGVAITRFGSDLYSEQSAVAGWGGGSGPLRVGGALRYTRVAIRGYGSAGVLTVDAGALVTPAPWLSAGFRITDLARPSLGGSGERVPSRVTAALMFSLPGLLDCSFQAGQDTRGRVTGWGALSVRCSPWLVLRGGASADFGRLHGGFLLGGGAGAGYSFSFDPSLGLSQMFSLTFPLPV